jgi:hypothetical protein
MEMNQHFVSTCLRRSIQDFYWVLKPKQQEIGKTMTNMQLTTSQRAVLILSHGQAGSKQTALIYPVQERMRSAAFDFHSSGNIYGAIYGVR